MASFSGIPKLPSSSLFHRILGCNTEAERMTVISEATSQDLSILFKTLVNPVENNRFDASSTEYQGVLEKQITEISEEVKKVILRSEVLFDAIIKGVNCKITHTDSSIYIEIDNKSTDQDLEFLKDRISLLVNVFGKDKKINIGLKPGDAISFQKLTQFMSDHQQHLHALDLREKQVNDSELSELLINCSHLNHLFIKSAKLKGEGLVGINHLRSLTTLNLIGCTSLTSLTLPVLPALTTLSLSFCTSLNTLTLPDLPALTTLNLTRCTSLTSLTLQDLPALTTLSLIGCTSLTSLTLTNLPALTTLNLTDCTSLTSLTLTNLPALTTLNLTRCTSLTSLTLPVLPALTTLSLIGCTSLTSLTLPDLPALTTLSLNGCTSLTSLTLPDLPALRTLGLAGCTSLTSLTLPNLPALTTLSLSGCTSLTSLTLPDLPSLTTLYLNGCTSLTSLTLTSLTLPDLPVLTTLYLIGLLPTQSNEQFLLTLFNIAKSTTHDSLCRYCIQKISNVYGDDHEYVQELIQHLILNSQNADPNSPYRIHRELLEKETGTVEHHPISSDYEGIRFNINTDWIQAPPQLPFIPFTYSKFEGLLNKVEQKLTPGSKAFNAFSEFFPDYTFEDLKKDISEGFYKQYLDGSAPVASSSSAPPQDKDANSQNKLSVTSCRLRKVLQCIDNIYANRADDDDFNDGDKAFIQMLVNVRTCGSGKITGVDHTYYSMAENKIYDEAELKEKGPLERIAFYINEELRRRRYNEFPLNNVHDKTYNLNLLGRELGLYAKGEKPKIDMNGNSVSLELRNLSKQEVLNRFYNTYTTSQLVEWVYALFNGDQIQIGDNPIEKWAVVSNTLNNTQPGDTEAKVWDSRYIQFAKDDTQQLFPLGVTRLGIAMILTKLGILTAIGE